jgi:pSer/pThr/pTyr-binding forkhead associated (FHA) protein
MAYHAIQYRKRPIRPIRNCMHLRDEAHRHFSPGELDNERTPAAEKNCPPPHQVPAASPNAATTTTWELYGTSGPDRGRRWTLGTCSRIGRDRDNEISLAHDDVSRLHAVVEKLEGEYWIQDNRSLNGTLVNGLPISQSVRLCAGDRIQVAATEFVFRPSSAALQVLDSEQTVVLATGGLERMLWATGFSSWQTASETKIVPSVAKWELCARSGPEVGRRWLLGDRTCLGRSRDNDISLAGADVSRLHAIIERRDGGYWIADNHSLNGTLVNSISVHQPVKLSDGDVVRIAGTEFVFRPSAAPDRIAE